jgi:TetR/AcrR family transcriptional repressor of nem operon
LIANVGDHDPQVVTAFPRRVVLSFCRMPKAESTSRNTPSESPPSGVRSPRGTGSLRSERAGKKSKTRARIVAQAARMVRSQGLEKPAIDDVMAAARLTRGGFYAHFENRDQLIAEALQKAFEEAHKYMFFLGEFASSPKANLQGRDWVEYASRHYLSEGHIAEAIARCPVPVLGSEVARAASPVRDVFTDNMKTILDKTAKFLGSGNRRDRDRGIRLLSSWFGAMTIARAVNDEALAAEIVDACKRETLRDFDDEEKPTARKKSAPRSKKRDPKI